MSNISCVLYIITRLTMRISIEMNMNPAVARKFTEFPRPNQAVSENGIYRFRKTMANRTEKVTVPSS